MLDIKRGRIAGEEAELRDGVGEPESSGDKASSSTAFLARSGKGKGSARSGRMRRVSPARLFLPSVPSSQDSWPGAEGP